MGLELPLVIGGISIVALTAIFFTVKNLIVICQPSEVVIFSGPKAQGSQRSGYIHIRGGRRLRIPLLERVEHMDLSTMSVDVSVRGAYTRDGVPINVQGVANIKIDGDMPGLDNAVERLMGKSNQEIMRIARQTLEGNLRGVLAKLTPEQVNEDKESFAEELVQEAEVDLRKLGLRLDILKIQTVSDDVGYLDAIGRKRTADLFRRARIAEAERTAESAVQTASNLAQTRTRQIDARIAIVRAEANKRIVSAQTQRQADIARERSVIDAQSARAEAELKVQQARIEQVRLKLEADLIQPAVAYRSQRQAQAKAAVARIKEGGQATARGMRELSAAWIQAGGDAREIFLLEKLRTLVGIMVGTVKNVHVDQITVVGDSAGQDTTAGKVASLMEQLKSGADIDVPALLKRLAIGVKASQPPNS